MLKSVSVFLNKEVILGEVANNTRKTFTIIVVLVFCLLFFFKPFSLNLLIIKTQLIISVGCSILAGLGYIIAISLFMPFKRKTWTVFMEFALVMTTFLIIWLFVYAYLTVCFKYKLPDPFYINKTIIIPQYFFYKTLLYTLGTACFVYLILRLYNNATYFKGVYDTVEIKTKKNTFSKNNKIQETLKLTGKNKDEFIVINSDDFVLAKSEGHYIKIYYLNDKSQKLNNYVLRNTMKTLENNLVDYNSIYRCHKSYFINLSHIKSIIGNSNKSHIYIKHYPNKIPISKQKIDYLKGIINSQLE